MCYALSLQRSFWELTFATAKRPELQAVSMAAHGPFNPYMYEMRPADPTHACNQCSSCISEGSSLLESAVK